MMNLASRLKYGWQLSVSVRNLLWSTNTIAKHSVDSSRRLTYAEPWHTDDMPQLTILKNGEKVRGTFSKVEMDRRISKLRNEMENKNINGVLFTSHHNINYYSDFMYCEVGRLYGLVVTHDKIVSISANVDGGYPWRRTVNGDNLVYTDWQRDNFYKGVNQELGQLKGKIGCEFDHISFDNYKKLHSALPHSRLVDIAESTMYLRMIKSDEEIAHITEGARIAEIGGGAVVEALAEGVSEHEIALHSTQTMVREIAKSRPDIALQDTLERTLFLDHASDEALRIWAANCEVHEAGMKLVRPGIKCKEIAQELNTIYEKHNLLHYRTFGYGHSFGVLCHYYGREAALELREDIETVLKPNMVLSMEPMVMLPEGQPGAGGYREHDILVVIKDGAKTLTHFPYGPEHMIIKK